MEDHEKSREQLVKELTELRQQVAALEAATQQKEEEQQRLLTAEREQRAFFEALLQTGATLTSTFRRDEVLDRILDQISRVVPYDAASIILFDENRGRVFRWRGYAKNSTSDTVVSVIPDLDEIPAFRTIRQQGHALAVSQTDIDDPWINQPGREWIRSYALAPIISRDKVIGVLSIDSGTPGFIEPIDAQYLHSFADQAAIALQNAWFYDRARYEIARRVRALKNERNFVTAILDTVGALVVVLDRRGRIVRYNRAYERATGFSVDEVKYRSFGELFLPAEESDAVKKVFNRLMAGQFPVEHKSHLKTRNGELRLVMWTNTVLHDEDGRPEYVISSGIDITERHQTEVALLENQKKYESLTEQLPIGVYQTSMNGELLQANPALAALFDYDSVDELMSNSQLSIYNNPYERRKLLEQFKHRGIIKNEQKYRTKSGKQIWIRNTGRVILKQTGEVDYIGGTIEDITERKIAEEALRESEERFRHLMSSISDHIYVTEISSYGQTRSIYLSPHIETLTGYPHERFIADWRFLLTVVIHPDDRIKAGTHLARALMGRSGEVEYRLIRSDGQVVWVRDSVRVETRKTSKILYGVVGDITQRKQAEEALATERERLAVTLRSITDGVVAIDLEGRIVLANPVARNYLATLANSDYGDLLTHLGDHRLDDILPSASDSHNSHEISLVGPPEQTFEVVAQRMDTDFRSHGWVLIIRNVTEKRAVQERIKQQERLAAVGQLAAGIAHDFNNILTAIIGIAELSGETPGIPPVVQADMKQIARQGERAARLTRQILDFGRKTLSEKWPLNLDTFLKEVLKLLTRTISEDIRISIDIEPGDYSTNADPTQIQQVVTNLAINAQDAMPSGGELKLKLTRFELTEGDPSPYLELTPGEWITLSVSDTGTGVSQDDMPHLFEPFFTTKEVGKGTGLGLAQVYGIVKQHDGYIDVDSRYGVGTTFNLYFPALPTTRTSKVTQDEAKESPPGDGELVLLVEDNSTVLRVTQTMLERLGYRVIVATNGREALEVFDQRPDEIELVLTDITMPEMGGIALSKALHTRNKAIKVIAMTGYPLKMQTEELLAECIVGWMSKPFSIEKLAQFVSQALK